MAVAMVPVTIRRSLGRGFVTAVCLLACGAGTADALSGSPAEVRPPHGDDAASGSQGRTSTAVPVSTAPTTELGEVPEWRDGEPSGAGCTEPAGGTLTDGWWYGWVSGVLVGEAAAVAPGTTFELEVACLVVDPDGFVDYTYLQDDVTYAWEGAFVTSATIDPLARPGCGTSAAPLGEPYEVFEVGDLLRTIEDQPDGSGTEVNCTGEFGWGWVRVRDGVIDRYLDVTGLELGS